ncbi:hypothetical protein [uncultured Stenotrophomonas sp.]|uniref:hypothetical protein n=1 Tax=uncultured Stenotrophomonas sp. TaxID=165438 RepID=UPI0025E4A5A6|nr:hypothetical protein [uncultured Stenotrophomonas sp.]
MLRRQAKAFAAVKAPEGFKIRVGKRHPAGFRIRYRGSVVLVAEHAPPWLRIGVPAGLESLAPEILQLRDWFQMWLEGVGAAVVDGDLPGMLGGGPHSSSRT